MGNVSNTDANEFNEVDNINKNIEEGEQAQKKKNGKKMNPKREKQKERMQRIENSINQTDGITEEKESGPREITQEEIEDNEILRDIFDLKFEEIKTVQLVSSVKGGTEVFHSKFEGKDVCFKVYNVKFTIEDSKFLANLEDNLDLMENMKHPNILKYYGCSLNYPKAGIVYDFYFNKSIKDYLLLRKAGQRGEIISWKKKLQILLGICKGMKFLHENSVVHGDLKCQNVILSKDLEPKIMDFVIAPLLEKKGRNFKKRIGKTEHQAPEITNGEEPSYASDSFAFGIMMHEIFKINFLAYGAVGTGVSYRVAKDENFRPLVDEEFPDWYVEVMKSCWSHGKKERYTFSDLVSVFSQRLKVNK